MKQGFLGVSGVGGSVERGGGLWEGVWLAASLCANGSHTNPERGDAEPSAAQVSLYLLLTNKALKPISSVRFRGLELYLEDQINLLR